jgi:small subunit ribosomal protein S21
MLIVKNKDKNIENALRLLKLKVQKCGIVQELRDRQEYVKPSVRRRNQILKAIYLQKKRESLEN